MANEQVKKQALVVYGGWDGHQPKETSERFLPVLRQAGFDITVRTTLDAYTDASLMGKADLIVQCWTMGSMTNEQSQGLQQAVSRGVGLAGWHGGLGDSFRGDVGFQWMTGGQFVGHPGNAIDFKVTITGWDDPITAGISDFTMRKTEQYYMLVDPANLVLATSTFSGDHQPYTSGVTMPMVWKRRWGKGKVFYTSLGHANTDFDIPECRIITERGLVWASR